MASISATTSGACGCCGGSTVCYLTMPTTLIDGTTTNYANSTAATAAISAQTPSGCMCECFNPGGGTHTVFTTTFVSGTFTITSQWTSSGGPPTVPAGDSLASRVYLTAADGLSITYNITLTSPFGPAGVQINLYADDQTTLVDHSPPGGTPYSGTYAFTVLSNGYYWIQVAFSAPGASNPSTSLTCTGGTSLLPCTARAAYDDGAGGTAYVVCV